MRNKIPTAIVLLAAACSDETVAPPPKAPVGQLEPVAVVYASSDIVTAKERALPELYATALSSSAPDGAAPFSGLAPLLNQDLAQFSSPGIPPAHEPVGIVAAHNALFGAFDDRHVAIGRVWRTPNEQSIEWIMTAKHTRDWMGIAGTRKAVSFKGLTLLWTKDDGTIVDIHVYFDVGLLKLQLGGTGPKELFALPLPVPPTGPAQVFEQTQTASASNPNGVAIVKSWLDALENNKESDYMAALAEAPEIYTLERVSPMKGKDDIKKYYKATRKAIGQLDATINNAWGIAEFAIVEYGLDGEQLGTFSWIPLLARLPTRTTQLAHFDLVDVCEIRDGKIARIWRYDNPAEVLAGAALLPRADAGISP
jgi:hypothetical protein